MELNYLNIKKVAQYISQVMRNSTSDNDHEIQKWIDTTSGSKEAIDFFSDDSKLVSSVASFDQKELCEKSLNNFKQNIEKGRISRRRAILWKATSVAASLTAVLMITWVAFKYIDTPSTQSKSESIRVIVAPTLILANGNDIKLDNIVDAKAERYVKMAEINKSTSIDNKIDSIDRSKEFNTIVIPNKFTYSIILCDGTKVILNANSKLIYPTVFNTNSRNVILEGEAFFDVVKSKTPFCVISCGVNIKVYGTQFNVNSYNPYSVETVLLTGSVGVSLDNGTEHILKPNQSIQINVNSHMAEIKNVNGENYTQWIDGKIKSYDAQLGDLVNKLSKWYGVEFEYFDEEKRSIAVTASFDNSQSIESIITSIEYSVKVKFVKNERGYIIY